MRLIEIDRFKQPLATSEPSSSKHQEKSVLVAVCVVAVAVWLM
jgi:hypothetical protein